MIQILILYETAFFHKTGPEWRQDRTATWMALQMNSFRLPLGDLLASFPTICKFLTFSVIHWQLLGPWLYLSPILTGPLKAFVALGFASMHIGFALSLRLEMFNWITLSASLTLIPNWFWEKIRQFLTRERLILRYDIKNKISVVIAHFIGTFFLIPDIVVVRKTEKYDVSDPGRIEEGLSSSTVIWLEVEDDFEGLRLKNFDALEKLVKSSLLFWPLAKFSCFRRLNRHITRFASIFSQNRTREINNSSEPKKTRKPKSFTTKKLKTLLCWSKEFFILIIILSIVIWNLRDVNFIDGVPDLVKDGIMALQLDQSWRMFSPSPPDSDFWYTMVGETVSGKKIELFHNGGLYHWKASAVSWDKPKSLLTSFRNHRWVKYFENGLNDADDNFVGIFARWVCDQYNKRQLLEKNQIEFFTIYVMSERYNASDPFAAPIPLPKEHFWEQACFPDQEKND